MKRQHLSVLLSAAAIGLLAMSPGAAQTVGAPMVDYVPTSKAPTMPQGLQLGCVKESNNGAAPSDTCPVVKYQGLVTWIFSYADNRGSFALVSYDERGNLVRNVEKPGARYIFDAVPSARTQTVLLVGQAQGVVTVPFEAFGTGNVQKK